MGIMPQTKRHRVEPDAACDVATSHAMIACVTGTFRGCFLLLFSTHYWACQCLSLSFLWWRMLLGHVHLVCIWIACQDRCPCEHPEICKS